MKKLKIKKERIAVLMSGGVDSSVSALLLKKQGFEVEGFFIKFWTDNKCNIKKEENKCCNDEALRDARNVAKKIDIPLHVVGARNIFKKCVVDYFIDEYSRLCTPNPCVKCNRLVKFGWFMEIAKQCGFDKVASGHYAQIRKNKDGIFHLLSGRDEKKDQGYFLHYLDQEKLSRIIFPVGNLRKAETRKIAKENNLSVSEKKESQEVCFVPDDDYRAFLKRHSQGEFFKPGKIVNTKNEILGKHSGLTNYTIGQRKGLGEIRIKNENSRPMFVLGFNEKKNELIVGSEEALYQKEMILKDVNWISKEAEELAFFGKGLKVKIRYRHEAVPCSAEKNGSKIKVVFQKSQRAITPGQSAVFYFKKEVMGGGIIVV